MSIEASPRTLSAEEVRDLVHGPENQDEVVQEAVATRLEHSSDAVAWSSNWPKLGEAALAKIEASGNFYNSTLNVITPKGKGHSVGTTSSDPQVVVIPRR